MIQLSSPPQGLSPPPDSAAIAAADFSEGYGPEAQKEIKPGFFAKLLEHFTQTEKSDILPPDAEQESLVPAGENLEAFGLAYVFAPNDGIAGAQDFAAIAASGAETPAAEAVSAAQLALFTAPAEQGAALQNAPEGSRLFEGDFAQTAERAGQMPQAENGAFEVLAEKEAELSPAALLSPHTEKADAAKTPAAEGFSAPAAESEAFLAALQEELAAQSSDGENAAAWENRGKKEREQITIEVRDLRTAAKPEGGGIPAVFGEPFPQEAAPEFPHDMKFSLQSPNDSGAVKSGGDVSASRLLEDSLAKELRGGLSSDIVRNAALIVRNGGEGTIHLTLQPESLGKVKIHIEMTENKLMGHITVESSEALRAFERELPVLEKAFKDSGFMETSLEMTFTQDGLDSGADEQQEEENFPGFDPLLVAARYDAGAELIEGPSLSGETVLSALPERKSINLFI